MKRAGVVASCYILELGCQMCVVGFNSKNTNGHRLVEDLLHTVPGSAARSADRVTLRMKCLLFSFLSLNLWLISIVFPVSP